MKTTRNIMGRKIHYKEYVSVLRIDRGFSGKCRYLAKYALKNDFDNVRLKEKVATVILKNPSKADEEYSDQTINSVLEYMHIFHYSIVYIVNLIPVYATNSIYADVDLWSNQEIIKKNKEHILDAIEQADKIFVGWGGNFLPTPQLLAEQIKYVKQCIVASKTKKMYCYEINKSNGQPRHPCRNGWKGKKPEEEFVEFV